MPGPLAQAAVEVAADIRRFDDDLQRKLERSVSAASKAISHDLDNAADNAEKAGRRLGKGVTDGLDRIKKDADLASEFIATLETEIRSIDPALKAISDDELTKMRRDAALTRAGIIDMERAIDHAGIALDSLDGNDLDSVARAARVAGEAVSHEIGLGVDEAQADLRDLARTAETTGARVDRAMRKAGTNMGSQISRGSGRAGRALSGINLAPLASGLGNVALLGVVATGAIAAFGLSGAASLEQTQIAFEGMLGSAEKADAFIKRLQHFAATTPFEFAGLTHSTQQLLALGQTTDQAISTMTTIGNAAAAVGAGADAIDRVTLAIAQATAKGKLQAQEINQITEALPNFNRQLLVENLAKDMHKSKAEVLDMLNNGLVPAKDGVKALLETLQQLPGATGAMARQSQSLAGLWSTFTDTVKIDLTNAFKPLVPAAKDELEQLTPLIHDTLTTFAPALEGFLTQLGPVINDFVTAAGPLLKTLFDALAQGLAALEPALPVVAAAFQQVFDALAPVIPVLAGAFASAVEALAPLLEPLAEVIAQVATALAPLVPVIGAVVADGLRLLLIILRPVIDALVGALAPVIPVIADAFVDFGNALAPVAEALGTALADAITQIAPFLPDLAQAAADLAIAMVEMLAAITPLLPQLIELALRFFTPGVLETVTGLVQQSADLAGSMADLADKIPVQQINDFMDKLNEWAAKAPALTHPFQNLADTVQRLGGWFSDTRAKIGIAIGDMQTDIQEFPAKAGIALSDLKTQIGEKITGAWNNAYATTTTWLGRQVATIAGLPGRAAGALGSLGSSISAKFTGAWNQAKASTLLGIGSAVGYIRALPGKAAAALGNIGGTLKAAGGRLIGGFIDGINSRIADVKAKLSQLTGMLPNWKGPPSKDRKLLLTAGKNIIRGLVLGLQSQFKNVHTALRSFTADIPRSLNTTAVRHLASMDRQLDRLATRREGVAKRLTAAQKRLTDAIKDQTDFAAKVKASTLDFGSITGLGLPDKATAGAIVAEMRSRLAATRRFTANLGALRKLGLNSTTYRQLVEAGVEQGASQAAALLSGGRSAVLQVNSLTKQLGASAISLGNTSAKALYGAGVNAARALVKGLQSQQSALTKQMVRLANSLIAAVRRALKIRSPSLVFQELGELTAAGMDVGLRRGASRIDPSVLVPDGSVLDLAAYKRNRAAGTARPPRSVEVHAPVNVYPQTLDSTAALSLIEERLLARVGA